MSNSVSTGSVGQLKPIKTLFIVRSVGLKDGGPAECTPDSTDTKSCCDSNGYGRGIVRDFSIIVGAVIRMIAAKAEDFVMNDFDDEYKVMKERSFKPGGFGVLDEDSSVWSRVTDSCIGMLLISNDAELIHRIPHSNITDHIKDKSQPSYILWFRKSSARLFKMW